MKTLVNLYTWDEEHFEAQAIIKRLYYKYKCRTAVIDANGLGIGLVDFMVKDQIDPETGENYYQTFLLVLKMMMKVFIKNLKQLILNLMLCI